MRQRNSKKPKQRPITHRQILEVQGLESEIANHAIIANDPYSALTSAVLSFVLIDLAASTSYLGPYLAKYQYGINEKLAPVLSSVAAFTQHVNQAKKTSVPLLKNIFREFGDLLNFSTLNMAQALQLIESSSVTSDTYRQKLIALKALCLEIAKPLLTLHPTFFDPANMPQTCALAMNIETWSQKITELMKTTQVDINKLLVQANFLEHTTRVKNIATILIDRFFIRRIYQRFLPQGLFQPRIPIIPPKIAFLSQTDADKLIVTLKSSEQHLKSIATRNRKIGRGLLLIFFTACFIIQGRQVSPYLMLLLTALLNTAASGIVTETKAVWTNYRDNKTFRQNYESLQRLFPTLQTEDKGNLKLSRFLVSVNKRDISTWNRVLGKHGIPVKYTTNDAIYFPASFCLPKKTNLEKIQSDIRNALQHKQAITQLKNFLYFMHTYYFITLQIVPIIEQDTFEKLHITLKIPPELQAIFSKTFHTLNPHILSTDEQSTIIEMQGHLIPTKSHVLLKELKNYHAQQSQSEYRIEHPQAEKPKKSRRHATVDYSKGKEEAEPISQPVPLSEVKNGHLIINSVRGKQFTLFKLSPEDFPDQKSFEKFKAIITEYPKFVRAPKGESGLKFLKNGSVKAKSKGKHGGIRVYADKHVIKGSTVYEFNRVVTKHP